MSFRVFETDKKASFLKKTKSVSAKREQDSRRDRALLVLQKNLRAFLAFRKHDSPQHPLLMNAHTPTNRQFVDAFWQQEAGQSAVLRLRFVKQAIRAIAHGQEVAVSQNWEQAILEYSSAVELREKEYHGILSAFWGKLNGKYFCACLPFRAFRQALLGMLGSVHDLSDLLMRVDSPPAASQLIQLFFSRERAEESGGENEERVLKSYYNAVSLLSAATQARQDITAIVQLLSILLQRLRGYYIDVVMARYHIERSLIEAVELREEVESTLREKREWEEYESHLYHLCALLPSLMENYISRQGRGLPFALHILIEVTKLGDSSLALNLSVHEFFLLLEKLSGRNSQGREESTRQSEVFIVLLMAEKWLEGLNDLKFSQLLRYETARLREAIRGPLISFVRGLAGPNGQTAIAQEIHRHSLAFLSNLYNKIFRTRLLPTTVFEDPSINIFEGNYKFGNYGNAAHLKEILKIVEVCPFLLPLDTRFLVFRRLTREDAHHAYGHDRNLTIHRGQEFEEALAQLYHRDLRNNFRVRFINQLGFEEMGMDAGGLTKELLTRLFNLRPRARVVRGERTEGAAAEPGALARGGGRGGQGVRVHRAAAGQVPAREHHAGRQVRRAVPEPAGEQPQLLRRPAAGGPRPLPLPALHLGDGGGRGGDGADLPVPRRPHQQGGQPQVRRQRHPRHAPQQGRVHQPPHPLQGQPLHGTPDAPPPQGTTRTHQRQLHPHVQLRRTQLPALGHRYHRRQRLEEPLTILRRTPGSAGLLDHSCGDERGGEVPAAQVRNLLRTAQLPRLQGPQSALHHPRHLAERHPPPSLTHLQQRPRPPQLLLPPRHAPETTLRHQVRSRLRNGMIECVRYVCGWNAVDGMQNLSMVKGLLLLAVCVLAAAQNFTLYRSSDPSAKCLDGSPAALYFQAGTEADKFLIFFESGGLCRGDGLADTIEYCYKRSFTSYGSSADYPASKSFDNFPFLTPDSTVNPFHTWNRVFLTYCDGSLHVGSRLHPVQYKERDLYFRGSNNTLAHFAFLDQQFGLFSAANITVTGTSAGGVAALIWSNFVHERAQHKEGVLVVPDSATMILDFPNLYNNKTITDYTIETYRLVLEETTIPLSECANKYPSQVECFQSGNLYEFIRPRLFLLQSQYDSWGLIQVLQFRCVPNVNPSNLTRCNDTERAYIERYRQKVNEAMRNLTSVDRNGVWSVSCVQHGFLEFSLAFFNSIHYRAPANYGKTILVAMSNFLNGLEREFIDDVDWPNNQGCNGLGSAPWAAPLSLP